MILLGFQLAATRPAGALETVTIGIDPSISAGATYIAIEKGYFREAGIAVATEIVDSSSAPLGLLATNHLQVIEGGIAASYWKGLSQHLPIILALERGSTPMYHELMLSPSRKDEIKQIADLKGKVIGLSGPGSVGYYEVGKILASAGLRLQDVVIRNIPYAQTGTALADNAVDAALAIPPFSDLAAARGFASPWLKTDALIAPAPVEGMAHLANTDWLAKNRDLADRFFVALLRGVRDFCQAYHHGPNRAEVEEIFLAHKLAADSAMLETMPWTSRNPAGRFNLESLADLQNWLKAEGAIAETFPQDRLVDASFADYASSRLPPFELINKASPLEGCR